MEEATLGRLQPPAEPPGDVILFNGRFIEHVINPAGRAHGRRQPARVRSGRQAPRLQHHPDEARIVTCGRLEGPGCSRRRSVSSGPRRPIAWMDTISPARNTARETPGIVAPIAARCLDSDPMAVDSMRPPEELAPEYAAAAGGSRGLSPGRTARGGPANNAPFPACTPAAMPQLGNGAAQRFARMLPA